MQNQYFGTRDKSRRSAWCSEFPLQLCGAFTASSLSSLVGPCSSARALQVPLALSSAADCCGLWPQSAFMSFRAQGVGTACLLFPHHPSKVSSRGEKKRGQAAVALTPQAPPQLLHSYMKTQAQCLNHSSPLFPCCSIQGAGWMGGEEHAKAGLWPESALTTGELRILRTCRALVGALLTCW